MNGLSEGSSFSEEYLTSCPKSCSDSIFQVLFDLVAYCRFEERWLS